MKRRNFLKGVFSGIVGGAVIVKATDAEIAAFVPPTEGAPLATIPPADLSKVLPTALDIGDLLYDDLGHYLGAVHGRSPEWFIERDFKADPPFGVRDGEPVFTSRGHLVGNLRWGHPVPELIVSRNGWKRTVGHLRGNKD